MKSKELKDLLALKGWEVTSTAGEWTLKSRPRGVIKKFKNRGEVEAALPEIPVVSGPFNRRTPRKLPQGEIPEMMRGPMTKREAKGKRLWDMH